MIITIIIMIVMIPNLIIMVMMIFRFIVFLVSRDKVDFFEERRWPLIVR